MTTDTLSLDGLRAALTAAAEIATPSDADMAYRKNLMRRARSLGRTDLVPAHWRKPHKNARRSLDHIDSSIRPYVTGATPLTTLRGVYAQAFASPKPGLDPHTTAMLAVSAYKPSPDDQIIDVPVSGKKNTLRKVAAKPMQAAGLLDIGIPVTSVPVPGPAAPSGVPFQDPTDPEDTGSDDLLDDDDEDDDEDEAPIDEVVAEKLNAMLALYPDAETAAAIVLSGDYAESADDLHCTIVYLGDVTDVDPSVIEDLRTEVSLLAAQIYPFTADLNGLARFTSYSPDDDDAIVLNVDSPAITDLREMLDNCAEDCGIDAPDTHGFSPHITTAYLPADISIATLYPNTRLDEPVTASFRGITLAIGGVREEFPFADDTEDDPDDPNVPDETDATEPGDSPDGATTY